ncbi:hypothetical protein U9M48_016361 [Paspalum notatum var. saurae]|uniref:Cellulose synthase-like protein G2 n=1 Tax=Paspalum notatum var. saurae TaxID=547442 RepID=A0AAQ3WMR4_PASNO
MDSATASGSGSGGGTTTMATPPPLRLRLSAVHVNKALVAANRLMAVVHAALVSAFIARRTTSTPLHAAMVVADLTLLFLWALSQAAMWRPVRREAFPERLLLPLPGLDVVVVTADPDKEPPLGVMNTVLSAMALDYPGGGGGRLSVYLSDDAGSPLTLLAARKAYAFARAWVPFCRKHAVQCPCPDRYLAMALPLAGDDDELAVDRRRIKEMYEAFKAELEAASKDESVSGSWTKAKRQQDHDAYVEVISISSKDEDQGDGGEEVPVPLLVYVSREKRGWWAHHHFKAGALNALLRVSGLLTNAPYLLVLDCDMACNTRSSAMEAMCFHLDEQHPIAFLQFPQMFHNLSANDIYTNDLRYIFHTRWFGLDGLRGPILSGTGFIVRRDAMYGAPPPPPTSSSFFSSMDDAELRARFGDSDRLVESVKQLHQHQQQLQPAGSCSSTAEEDASSVASCAFEAGTGWGHQVGFMYQCVVEDYFTGYRRFFARGWTSAYYFPTRPRPPAFLGAMPTNLNDVLVQNKRWMAGMLTVGLSSRYCPLACAPLLAVSVPQAMAIAYFGLAALYAVPALCYATLPQLCFLRGVPLFDGDDGLGWWLAAACFASSLLQHLVEASVARRRLALRTFWNEQRFWMLNAVTGQLFGCVSAVQDLLGAAPMDFDLTAKQADDDGGRLYQQGVFDFTGCSTLLLPATTLCVLNAAALLGGTWRMLMLSSGSSGGARLVGDLFPQLFLLCYIAALSYPLLEGMFLRLHDPARVPTRITALSLALAALLLAVFG